MQILLIYKTTSLSSSIVLLSVRSLLNITSDVYLHLLTKTGIPCNKQVGLESANTSRVDAKR